MYFWSHRIESHTKVLKPFINTYQTVFEHGRRLWLRQAPLFLVAFLLPNLAFALDLQQMLVNLSATYPSIIRLITAFCYLTGMSFSIAAIYHLKVYGELRTMMASQAGMKEPLMYFLVAAVLLYLPTAIDTMLLTVFDQTEVESLSYATTDSSMYQQSLKAILGLVQVIGLISFVRGWIMMKKSSEMGQRGGYGKGITHILGGILAMNIIGTKEVIFNTFGIS